MYRKLHAKRTGDEDTLQKALQTASNILSRTDCSEKAMAQKLTQRGYSPSVCAETVAKLVAAGLIDEARQIEAAVAYLAEKTLCGKQKIVMTLRQKGYDSDRIEAIDWDEYDFYAICQKRMAQTYRRGVAKEDYRKVYATMLRHGFTSDQIKEAFSQTIEP